MHRVHVLCWGLLAGALVLCRPAAADGPVETWEPVAVAEEGMVMPRGETVVYEFFANLGVQEGLVLGEAARSLRAPLSIKPLVGFSFLELGSSRLMLGATLAFPFSIEMGYGHDLAQLAVAPGVTLSRRECANWGWFAGVEVPIVITPERIPGASTETLVGVGLRGGAAWYFLAGLGVYGEANVELYFGPETAATLGVTGGLVLSYEIFRFKAAGTKPAGGPS
jgi:hypothetical protein